MGNQNQESYEEFLKNNTTSTEKDNSCEISFNEHLTLKINDKEVEIYKIKCASDNNIVVCNKLDNYRCELVNISEMPKDFVDTLCKVYPEICKD
jgi:GTPase involved in cell partitioning and DNA repair